MARKKNDESTFSVKKIAGLAGVSQSTVSRAINNYSNVNAETKAKILRIIEELDCTPQQLARHAVAVPSTDIGLVVADVNNGLYAELSRLIVQRAEAYGSSVLLCNVDNNSTMIDSYIQVLLQKKISGIIFAAIPLQNRRFMSMLENDFPCILCNRRLIGLDTNYVTCDNEQGGLLVMEHLIGLGHGRIGFITGPETMAIYAPRFGAYKKALELHGIEYDSSLVVHTVYRADAANAAARTLLKIPDPPTAIFCVNDTLAMGALDYIISSGRRVPEDVALAGYDNTPISNHSAIQLTTVDCSAAQLAMRSVDGLLRLIKNPSEKIRIQEVVPPRLLVRRTTVG